MPKTKVTLGFKAHVGWSAVVAIASRADGLEVVAKRRLDLATTFEEGAIYHMGAELPLAEALPMIAAATKKFDRGAAKLVTELCAELARAGHTAQTAALVWGSTRPLPPVETVLKSHTLIHTAEGQLYRLAFAHGSEAAGLRVVKVPSRELERVARTALGVTEAALRTRLAALGKASGRPWAADQKESALAAIAAL